MKCKITCEMWNACVTCVIKYDTRLFKSFFLFILFLSMSFTTNLFIYQARESSLVPAGFLKPLLLWGTMLMLLCFACLEADFSQTRVLINEAAALLDLMGSLYIGDILCLSVCLSLPFPKYTPYIQRLPDQPSEPK